MPSVTLAEIDPSNWRACADLEVTDPQQAFVAPVTQYLAMCAYGATPWHPWAVVADGNVVGFVMSGTDPTDGSSWIGGLLIDGRHQRKGYGAAVVSELVDRAAAAGHPSVALSYRPANTGAAHLHRRCGFIETGETDGDEVVARLLLRSNG